MSEDGGDDATTKDTGTNDTGPIDAGGASDAPTEDSSISDADASDSSAVDGAAEAAIEAGCQQPADCADAGASTACCGTLVTNGNQQSCQISTATTTCLYPSHEPRS